MGGIKRQLALAAVVASLCVFLLPAVVSADITGPCDASATASVTGPVDFNTQSTWHVKEADVVNGEATYPTQTYLHVYVFLFGIPVPVYSSSGNGTSGSAGPFHISDYSRYTRVFAAGGTSDSCTGAILIIVDDQSPIFNAVGLAGLFIGLLGLIAVALITLVGSGPKGCGSIVFGGIGGLGFGLGAALLAMEFGLLNPESYAGSIIAGVTTILGAIAPPAVSRVR